MVWCMHGGAAAYCTPSTVLLGQVCFVLAMTLLWLSRGPRRQLVAIQRGGHVSSKWDNSGLSRAAELHLLLRQEVMLRRLKSQVMAQLPPKRRQVVMLPQPKPSDWPSEGLGKGDQQEGDDGEEAGACCEELAQGACVCL